MKKLIIYIFIVSFFICKLCEASVEQKEHLDPRVDTLNMELVGQYPFGTANAVDVNGNYAYLCAGGNLIILDVSNPVKPTEVSRLDTPGIAWEVHVVGNYAYIANGHCGLIVVDISDIKNPRLVGEYNTPGYAAGLYVVGHYVYVADGESGVRVIDVSDPETPNEIASSNVPKDASSVYVDNDRAYIAAQVVDDASFYIMDVSNPDRIEKLGSYNPPGYTEKIAVAGHHAYISSIGLRVIDVSNPGQPKEVTFFRPRDLEIKGISISGNYLYATIDGYGYKSGVSGLFIIDISSPENLKAVAFYETKGIARRITAIGKYAYVIYGEAPTVRTLGLRAESGLRIFDISEPDNPRQIGNYDTPGIATKVYVDGDYAFITDRDKGLRIINISDPRSLYEVSGFTIPGYMSGIYVANDYAYCADYNAGLRIIHISDPTNPREVGSYNKMKASSAVYVADEYAYVCGLIPSSRLVGFELVWGDYGGVAAIDISNSSNPQMVDSIVFFDVRYPLDEVYVKKHYVYASSSRGFDVIDANDPKNLVLSYSNSKSAYEVYVDQDYAYVAASDGLKILDISNPKKPIETGFYSIPDKEYISDVYISGEYAYCVSGEYTYYLDGNRYVRVIDISDPTAPHQVGFYCLSSSAEDIFVSAGNIYVANGRRGLCILRYMDAK